MAVMAGWPALIAPFLVQNIGWFIGGLCFVAGSIFLVTYTTGFAKTLTSFAVLSVYTLLLLGAGYQIRRRQPALELSSSALLILGMLLVPQCRSGSPSAPDRAEVPGLLTLGLLAVGLGWEDCTSRQRWSPESRPCFATPAPPYLSGAHVGGLLGVPVLALLPFWPLLVVCHGILLAILAYGVVLFTQDWLHAIFIERRKLAYYTAGTLVYATLVSFVHVTRGYQEAPVLPSGYYGRSSSSCAVCCSMWTHISSNGGSRRRCCRTSVLVCMGCRSSHLLAVTTPLALLCTLILAVVLYGCDLAVCDPATAVSPAGVCRLVIP